MPTAFVPYADYPGTPALAASFDLRMQHWVRSFSSMALIAGVIALGAWASAVGTAAMATAAVFAVLAALAVVTDMLGRGRDGLYSGERAVWLVGVAIAVVLLAREEGVRDWVAEAGYRLSGIEDREASRPPIPDTRTPS